MQLTMSLADGVTLILDDGTEVPLPGIASADFEVSSDYSDVFSARGGFTPVRTYVSGCTVTVRVHVDGQRPEQASSSASLLARYLSGSGDRVRIEMIPPEPEPSDDWLRTRAHVRPHRPHVPARVRAQEALVNADLDAGLQFEFDVTDQVTNWATAHGMTSAPSLTAPSLAGYATLFCDHDHEGVYWEARAGQFCWMCGEQGRPRFEPTLSDGEDAIPYGWGPRIPATERADLAFRPAAE